MSKISRIAGLLSAAAISAFPVAAFAQARCAVTPDLADPTQDFCQNPNYPLYGSGTTSGVITNPLPINAAATVGHGLALQPGSSNAFFLLMGSKVAGANMTTSASIRDMFYMNYMSGNLYTTVGCPIDTGQGCGTSPFNAVARHYAAGSPGDLHVMVDEGMQLRATCTGKGRTDCSQGNVYAAMVRVPFEIRPGMTVKVRYRSPYGQFSWAPVWLFSGSEVSPGPETEQTPYVYPYDYPIQYSQGGAAYEIDMNDNYGRWYNSPSVPIGYQIDFLTPNIYGVPWTTPPYTAYMASTNGFTAFPNAGPSFVEAPYNLSKGFHDLVMSWDASSGFIYEYLDGRLVVKSFLDYSFAPWYVDPADGVRKQQAMHLIIGNQAIPRFAPGYEAAVNNDGIPGGWTIAVQEIAAWYGTVVPPAQ